MEQVLYNLIYNATQYTPENSSLTSARSSESELVILIEDDGPGFPGSRDTACI